MRRHRSLSACASALFALAACGADPLGVEEALPDEVPFPGGPTTASATATPSATASAGGATPPEAGEDPEGSRRFTAVVQVSKEKDTDEDGTRRRLVFSGVTLAVEGVDPKNFRDATVVASYSQGAVWRGLDGKRVRALGQPYSPEGRAIAGQHMDILEAALVDPGEGATVLGFGRGREIVGTLREVTTPADQKGAGEKVLYFDEKGGASYEVFEGFTEDSQRPDTKTIVKVRAHEVFLSKTMQRRGGPFLWVRWVVK